MTQTEIEPQSLGPLMNTQPIRPMGQCTQTHTRARPHTHTHTHTHGRAHTHTRTQINYMSCVQNVLRLNHFFTKTEKKNCREEENLVFCFGAQFNSTLNFTQSG